MAFQKTITYHGARGCGPFKVGDLVCGTDSPVIGVVVFVNPVYQHQFTLTNFRRHRFAWMNRLHAWWLMKTYKAKK